MENKQWYFAIWFMAATGARVSELVRFKGENVEMGYVDLYTKGGKLRRIFIPAKLQKEALIWIEKTGRRSGFIFLNRFGNQITTRGLAQQIKRYAENQKYQPKWYIRIHSGTDMLRIFWISIMT